MQGRTILMTIAVLCMIFVQDAHAKKRIRRLRLADDDYPSHLHPVQRDDIDQILLERMARAGRRYRGEPEEPTPVVPAPNPESGADQATASLGASQASYLGATSGYTSYQTPSQRSYRGAPARSTFDLTPYQDASGRIVRPVDYRGNGTIIQITPGGSATDNPYSQPR